MLIFVKIGGGIKIKGGKRLNYLSIYLHCFPLIFSKILARSARLIIFYFHPNQGTRNGKVRLAFKSGTKKRPFSVPRLMT